MVPGDVKGRSVLLDRGEATGGAKLADFGAARLVSAVAGQGKAVAKQRRGERDWNGLGWAYGLDKRARVGRGGLELTWPLVGPPRWRPRGQKL